MPAEDSYLNVVSPVVGRMAPTPSGYMHLGNAINFVLCWLEVRSRGGILRLRIDDLDKARSRPAYLDDIFYSLDWIGLDWDTGPFSPGEQTGFSQTKKLDRYEELLGELRDTEKLTFVCDCSRKRLRETGGLYDGRCYERQLVWEKQANSIKIHTPASYNAEWTDLYRGPTRLNLFDKMRDFVVRRRDGLPAYQIVSLADDIDHGTNLIIRGADLMESTAAQLFLASHIPYNSFSKCNFAHHGLLQSAGGVKLSKSVQTDLHATDDPKSFMITNIRRKHSHPAFLFHWFSHMLKLSERADDAPSLLSIYKRQSATGPPIDHSCLSSPTLHLHPLELK